MKILFISTDNYIASGAFLSMVHLILGLRKLNIDAFVVLPVENEGGINLLDKHKISYIQVHSYNWILPIKQKEILYTKFKILYKYIFNKFAIHKISKIAVREKCEMVHINTMCSYVGAKVAHKLRIPLIWHLREYMEEDQGLKIWDKARGYQLVNSADVIVPVSQGIKVKYNGIFEEEKMCVVYNGIEPVFYNPLKKILNDKILKIILVGKICEKKGQITAILALRKYINQENRNIQLKIIGKGDEKYIEYLKKVTLNYGLQNFVEFIGNSQNIKDYYEWADISLMCSKCEAFGRVTVEAMMSGCLVIGSDAGGTVELVQDKINGLLFQVDNADDLFEKIKYAVKNKESVRGFACNAREIAMAKFTSDNNAKKIAQIYNYLLKGNSNKVGINKCI